MTASRHGLRRALAGLAVALLLTSCDSGGAASERPEPTPTPTPMPTSTASSTATQPDPAPDGPVYVALGDSYVSAPFVPRTNLRNGCLRSDHNFPHLLVQDLEGYELVDVSCAGASTAEMTQAQVVGGVEHPAQFDALDDDVDLVTLGIGANDFSLYSFFMYRCIEIADTDRTGAPCREANVEEDGSNRLLTQAAEVQGRIEAVLAELRERAPEARIVLVTFPKFLPDHGVCPDLVPLAKGDYAYVREVNATLSRAQAAAGAAAGVDVVDMYAASDGHDICSDQPWVNGIDTDPAKALAFHPFPVEQRAVADLLLELLGQG